MLILERDRALVGYAIVRESNYGWRASPVVDELTVGDAAAAEALLIGIAARVWEMRLSDFEVHEPLDSTVGRVARRLGCSYQQAFPASGGMMGMILDRLELLRLLEPELRRRLPGAALHTAHEAGFGALQQGELVGDNGTLLRLLVGYWSAGDAIALGTDIPAPYQEVCAAWFPGGGSAAVPLPYAHRLDRY